VLGGGLKQSIGRLAAGVLGVVLLLAAYAKALDPRLFTQQLADLLPVPASVAFPLAILIIAFEAGLGAALLRGWRHPVVLAATSVTFVSFLGVVIWHLLSPSEATGGCGCFGQLLERTPQQALYEDLAFVALSGLAWLGGEAAPRPRWGWAMLAAGASATLALSAPWLPLDDHATALAPGVAVGTTQLDAIVPELRTGRHLVLLLDRADEDTRARIGSLNDRLELPGGATPVWGVADDDPELALAFLWSAGPAFEVRGAPPRVLRRLYRTLPRSALIDAGRVVRTWSGLPSDAELTMLARGDVP
jgi:hypothetical protein